MGVKDTGDERARIGARTPMLLARDAVMRSVRAYFQAHDFVEV